MKKISLIICIILSFSFMPPAFAKTEQSLPAEGAVVKQEDIKKLIATLESESDRKNLISNLQILLNQQTKNDDSHKIDILPSLTKQFEVKGKIVNLVKGYENFLEKNAISASFFHKSLGSLISLFFGIIFFLGVKKISTKIILKIERLSEKIGLRLSRITFYTHFFQNFLKLLIIGIMTYTLSKIWNLEGVISIFESESMRSFLTSALTVLFLAIFAALIWEAIGAYLSYVLKQADDKNQMRVKTLLPLIRNIVLSFFGLLFGLVILSEMGLNVAPFLAGAGVLGVAIGFGAQSMVKDFLTGFTIVLEDIIRVGDIVSLGGRDGIVEKITLRKVQLRDFGGIVSTIPFSQITTIQNMTKNFSYYVLEIGVAYHQNTDDVVNVLKEVDKDLRRDKDFENKILEPIEIVGVERFDENAVIIKARIKTLPIKQWEVGREFNRRMKIAFDANNIEIPFPQRVILMKTA